MPPCPPPLLADFVSWWDGIERDIVHFVTCKLYHPWLDPVFLGVQSQTLASVLMGVLVVALVVKRPRRGLRLLLTAGVAMGIAMLLADLLWATIDRPRPPQAYDHVLETPEDLATCAAHPDALPLRMHRATSSSFPSRHGLSIGVLVTALLLAWRPVGWVALVYGAVAAVGRVYAGKHWASDVVAGIAIGALFAWLAWRFLPPLLDRIGLGHLVREAQPDGEPVAE